MKYAVALTWEQVEAHNLPPAMGKSSDSRAAASNAPALVQVEADALPPDVLHGMYDAALRPVWDVSAYQDAITREDTDREALTDGLTMATA